MTGEVAIASPDMPQKSLKLPITGSATYARDKGTLAAELATKFDESSIKAKLGHAPGLSFEVGDR